MPAFNRWQEAQLWRAQFYQEWLQRQDALAQPVRWTVPLQPEPSPAPDEEGNMINAFRVGCDPEFMLLKPPANTTDNASNYFAHNGEIGYDHGGRVAEFRPGPSRGILPLVKKLQHLVLSPRIQNLNVKLRAGALCNQDSLGGHIHFGFNCFAERPYAGNNGGGRFNEKGEQAVKALDALTKTLEGLDILPKDESARRRVHGQGYGQYGDVRDCNGHMEYRTMASWLYDPKVAFLVLTAAKLAAADPQGAIETLGTASWNKFETWLLQYVEKDINARRAKEKLLERGLKFVQVDPEVDFKGRWEELGV